MQRLKPFGFFILLAGIWLLVSSDADPYSHYSYTPYFMKRADLNESVFYTAGKRGMEDTGNIWVRGDRIFVNERYKGEHIIDNGDPYNPVQTGFIMAPGSLDMAARGGERA